MKLRDMKSGVQYIVTDGSNDGRFRIGDRVSLYEKLKEIFIHNIGVWVKSKVLKESGYLDKVFVDVDIEYLEKKIKEKKEQLEKEPLQQELNLLNSLLQNSLSEKE